MLDPHFCPFSLMPNIKHLITRESLAMPSGIEAVCTAALIADVVPLSIITKHIISLHLEKIYEIACMAILEPVSRASKQ